MKKAYGYTRTATKKQAKEVYSNGMQSKHIRKYCKKHNIHLLDIYSEVISGLDKKRPQLKVLIDNAVANKVDCVVVNDVDRLSRKYSFYSAIKSTLSLNNIELIIIRKATESKVYRAEMEKIVSIARLYRPKSKKQT